MTFSSMKSFTSKNLYQKSFLRREFTIVLKLGSLNAWLEEVLLRRWHCNLYAIYYCTISSFKPEKYIITNFSN